VEKICDVTVLYDLCPSMPCPFQFQGLFCVRDIGPTGISVCYNSHWLQWSS